MKKKNCKVDIVSVYTNYTEDSKEKLTFEEIITDKEVNNQELNIRGKAVKFSVIEDTSKFLIGFLACSKDKDLPAKVNKKTGKISALDVDIDESLIFGSIFLYSKELNTVFYEVNRDTIYLDGFIDYIYKCYHKSENLKQRSIFDLKFNTIFRRNEYERALNMDIYKGFKVRIHQPSKLLKELNLISSSIDEQIKTE